MQFAGFVILTPEIVEQILIERVRLPKVGNRFIAPMTRPLSRVLSQATVLLPPLAP